MPRYLRHLAIACTAVALSATAVAAFSALPDAAWNGLTKAQDVSGKTLPQRPATLPTRSDRLTTDTAADLPDAASHGAAVSAVATADDPTPDTNRGADVSAVAKDNHGQTVAADHRPTDIGAPDGAGKPAGAGKPDQPGQPADPGPPDGAGKPEGLPTHP
jgi:hypothetical protein